MNNVSEIWEMDIIIVEFSTIKTVCILDFSILIKNISYILVGVMRKTPKNIEKNNAIL
jgi:hypothetical protein